MNWVPTIALGVGILVLVIGLAISWAKGKLDLADAFKDEEHRTSMGRVIACGAWLASTWYLMSHDFDERAFWDYMVVNIVPYLGGALRDGFTAYIASKGKANG